MKWSDIAITIVLIACVSLFVHGADEITITGDWTIVRPVIRQDARGVDGAIAIVAETFADVLDEAIRKRPKVVEAGQEPQGPGGRLAARFHSVRVRSWRLHDSTRDGEGLIISPMRPEGDGCLMAGWFNP